ncbi:CLUMA_CG013692, isoform A [Clunio marinus]|uniref:CLUMA_CG013692, isoform A n=1 Tax=Clunio marinus TaxID=568069 RepID=A0A1J1IKY3_9DIPT|nr:CLUMA_CG013692, isoform A [Clunio marinus]
MKILIALALACFAVTANAQVRCLNPGSLEIPPSPCCGQLHHQGLAGALGNMFNLMDIECKVNMFFDAILTDPDMLAFFNYITGPEFRVLILSVQNMPEFKDFMWYFCENLDLDGYLYLNTLGDILGTPRMPHPEGDHCHPEFPFPWTSQKASPTSSLNKHKSVAVPFVSGVRKFMDDLQAEIPGDDIYDMWMYKVENDPYLCPGYKKLSSAEFRAIALKVEYDPEFIRFVDKLEEWGIEMKQFMDDLKWFLWEADYCRT